MTTVFHFFTPEKLKPEQVGGKALALIEMMQAGMPVPPGFVLSVAFFEPWIEALRATPAWDALRTGEAGDLQHAAAALQEACRSLALTDQQQAELDQARVLCGEAQLFAVRSSSPEEDLEGASFAGGYETSLGVRPAYLGAALRHSFASAFDARVFSYKREHGFDLAEPRIAVIVQQQIAAESAGVAFSLNPLNNCYDEAVVNANFGLGESVVAGDVEPDTFVVDKVARQIIETQIGKKEVMITLNPDGGTTTQSPANADQSCLTSAQVLELTDLLTRVEHHYRMPVDIEWAYAEGTLFLLQVRPITTYLPLPEEMVTAPGSPKRLYADSTLIEQGVKEPLSVLGTAFMRYVLNTMMAPMGGDAADVEGGAFTAGGRYYMNLSQSLRMMGPLGALAPGSAGDESVLDILDSIDLEQYLAEKPSVRDAFATVSGPFKMLPRMLPVLKAFRNPDGILRDYHNALPGHLQRIDNAVDSRLSMHQQALALTELLDFFFYEFGLPLVFAPQLAQSRIRKLFEEEAEQVKEQLLSLGISLPGNKTAEMGARLYDLAVSDAIQAHHSAEAFVTQLEQRTFAPEFLQAWDEFVAEFGARCPREIDVATPRPNEDPALLFEQLKGMSAVPGSRKSDVTIFEKARLKREAAYADLYQRARQKGKRQARSLEKYYRTWLALGGYRETPKHYVIQIVDLFRKRALQVAEKFVEAGRLDDPNQIFDLTIDDIDAALADASIDLRVIAANRVVLINKIKRSHLVARIVDSRGKVFYPPRIAAGEGELPGVAISPGVVRGQVKVLHTATEKPLLPGEILVTRATDPGWTPLFINAGGIILEIGGALQHGAVVTREYGIPCVSGLANATSLLKDGQMVEVDGANGLVRVLDGEMPERSPLSAAELKRKQALEAKKEKARARRKRRQTILRVLPLLVLPFVVLCVVVVGFMVVQLLIGQSFSQAAARLTELWQVGSPVLIGFTNVIGITALLGMLWRNRKRLTGLISKRRKAQ